MKRRIPSYRLTITHKGVEYEGVRSDILLAIIDDMSRDMSAELLFEQIEEALSTELNVRVSIDLEEERTHETNE